jgi:lipopolysaccharide/colanic/teichoic acid biosynthesis glycosyltransferase
VLKLDYVLLDEKHTLLVLSLYLDWFIAVLFGHQYNAESGKENHWNYIWSYFKSYIIVISLNISVAFILRVSHYDLLAVIQATTVYAFISFVILTSLSVLRRTTVKEENTLELKRINLYKIINAMPAGVSFDNAFQYEYPQQEVYSISLNNQLKEVYLKKFPNVYRFLNECINLQSFEVESSVVQRSNDILSIEILPDDTLEFFFNLRQMNDLRRINCYLIEINKKLKPCGIFISKIETINQRYKRYLKSYPYYLAKLFYLFDFIWERIFPKLPWFQKIYFALTRGNNRAVSFAEGLGRLYYCGYEIVNAKEIDNFVYFIAKKVMPPCIDPNPSYGPLFKMKRTGYRGKPIFVYKFRTMHPYAEYLQKFVYDKFSLQEGGKFNNDFRVTSWGKVFRKLWIDELPMFINFFKGELKLVGVRPLSNHYLSLYSTELRMRRINYKPGLVPPFYVDMPKTLSEIMQSEERYLDLYDKHPVLTDIKYFFKAAYNIAIRKKRSK